MLDKLKTALRNEATAIARAPYTFFFAVLAVSGAVTMVVESRYSKQLQELRLQIDTLRRQLKVIPMSPNQFLGKDKEGHKTENG
jgi:hypothetical protein